MPERGYPPALKRARPYKAGLCSLFTVNPYATTWRIMQ
jgi:hypothetical protein